MQLTSVLLISQHVSDVFNVSPPWQTSVTLSFLQRSICSSSSILPDGRALRCMSWTPAARSRQSNALKGAGEQTAVRFKQCVLRNPPVNGVNNKRRHVDPPMVLSDTAHVAWACKHWCQHREGPFLLQVREHRWSAWLLGRVWWPHFDVRNGWWVYKTWLNPDN